MMETEQKDFAGAKLGMWLFLFTELLLFGGLFILYAVYLARYPEEFALGAGRLDTVFGAINTFLLLTSSLSVAVSLSALQKENRGLSLAGLATTIVIALLFLLNKYMEWKAKFSHGIYPGSESLKDLSAGENIFYSLYYITTGLHGIHVVIGVAILTWAFCLVGARSINEKNSISLENSALYWHLVDLVWIFIFPLYYLLL